MIKMRLLMILYFFMLLNFSLFSQSVDSIYVKNYFDTSKTKLYEEGYLVKNLREGTWEEYTENGWLRFSWTYKNGLKNGLYNCYRENGQIEAVGNYTDGQLEGIVKIYDENNKLSSEYVWARKKDGASSELISIKNYNKNVKPDGTIEVLDGIKYIWAWGERFEMPIDTIKK